MPRELTTASENRELAAECAKGIAPLTIPPRAKSAEDARTIFPGCTVPCPNSAERTLVTPPANRAL
jgi:hypothetical protein